ncbi:MAG TPA: RNA polymerase-binding protein DksA [Steroidobacteraceae bacterium]|jgi:DnaK suppressor protein
MVAKKPAAKVAKLKKPAARKAEPVKKSAPAKKAAASRGKPVAARPAAKPAPKAPVAAPAAAARTAKTAKPAAPATIEKPTEKATEKPTEKAILKPVAKATAKSPVPPVAKAVTLVRPLLNRQVESEVAGNESDDNDAAESPSNLLAGPRNVKPYIARRGEQYMGKEQLEHFRNILNTWKRDLMQEVDRTVLHMKDEAANFPDPNDRATQESEFSLELRTRDRERKLIRKIEEAMKRIDDGSYGYCNETGEEIGIKRLEARPVATLCLEAQERRERREKQYGDRDDRYR